MLKLAAQLLRHRLGSAAATLTALTVGVMVLMSMGTLVESGLRYRPDVHQYAGADLIVAKRDITFHGKDIAGDPVTATVALPEGGTLPSTLIDDVRRIPGVAKAVADDPVPLVISGAPAQGHAWGSALLRPYPLRQGDEPQADDEIAVDGGLGLTVGRTADVEVGGVAHRYRVSGVTAPSGSGVVFFTDRRAAALSPHPGRVAAVGIMLGPGADRTAVDQLAERNGATVYSGRDRGRAEQSVGGPAAELLVEIGAAFGGYVVLLVAFVVAGTVGLAVRHRRRDLALLRAIAATPGQVRRMIVAEAGLLSLVAAAVGLPAGAVATRWLRGELVDRGFVSASFPFVPGVLSALAVTLLTALVAMTAALIAARRVTRIRPTEAIGEAAIEPRHNSRVRQLSGLLTFIGALSSAVVGVGTDGQAALAAAIGMLYLFVIAVALLAPWINRSAARLLGPVLCRVWGSSGYLAAANLRANAQGMVIVLTALVLSVGFGGSIWFLQDNLQRQTVRESQDGILAERALVSAAGLPDRAAQDARAVPGVRAVTAVRHTSVIVKIFDGDAEAVSAQAVDAPSAAQTMDLRVREGRLADLTGDTIAVSGLRADSQGWQLGEIVDVWLGDGTPQKLRVAAIYDRGFGFGEVTLPREVVAGHTATNLDDQLLVKIDPRANVDAALASLAQAYPGTTVVDADDLTGQLARDLALSAWLNKLLVGVMVAYAALAAANTMVMAALARGRELALLRLVGVTRRQLSRMVHAEQVGLLGVALTIGGAIAGLTLVAVVYTLTGQPVPYLPPFGGVVVLGGTTLLALLTTILPIGLLLRVPPAESIETHE